MARVLIPCYGTGPAIVVSDVDTVVGPARVAHQHPDGSWVRINADGSIGRTPDGQPLTALEIAAVAGSRGSDELRVFCPNPGSGAAFVYRMSDPGGVPGL